MDWTLLSTNTSSTVTAFSAVSGNYVFDNATTGNVFNDITTNCGTTSTNSTFYTAGAGTQRLYFGSDNKFDGLRFKYATPGVGGTVTWNYTHSGTVGNSLDSVVDGTSGHTQDGDVYWDQDNMGAAGSWDKHTINGQNKYWINVQVGTDFTTDPTESIVHQLDGSNTLDITFDTSTYDDIQIVFNGFQCAVATKPAIRLGTGSVDTASNYSYAINVSDHDGTATVDTTSGSTEVDHIDMTESNVKASASTPCDGTITFHGIANQAANIDTIVGEIDIAYLDSGDALTSSSGTIWYNHTSTSKIDRIRFYLPTATDRFLFHDKVYVYGRVD